MTGFLLIYIVPLVLSVVIAWLIGRKVFFLAGKESPQKGNGLALLVALITQVVLFIALLIGAIEIGGGFSR